MRFIFPGSDVVEDQVGGDQGVPAAAGGGASGGAIPTPGRT